MTSTHSFDPSPWGRLIRARREQQGRSVRQAARTADVSDSYWGQVERGYKRGPDDTLVPVHPTRRTLLDIAEALRMTPTETSAVLAAAGHDPYVPGETVVQRESQVDLTGLTRRDVALLNVIADRFRAQVATQTAEDSPAAPLRAVASGQRSSKAPQEARDKARRARQEQQEP